MILPRLRISRRLLVSVFVLQLSLSAILASDPPTTIPLWPGKPPGDKVDLPEERDMTKPEDRPVAGKPVIRIGNVSKPTITIYRQATQKKPGAAVVVFPGGGYNILATDLEGTEICEWLNSLGITAILLKYRVPKREGLEKHVAPLQDAQRALGLVRQRAGELNIDPNRIGVLGFSAGGHLAATLTANSQPRTYETVDAADTLSCRPDFQVLIYPGYLTAKDVVDKLAPEVQVTTNHPPTFLTITQDDPVHVEGAVLYYLALKQAKVPGELHVFPTGGHGYGLRRTDKPVTRWPDLAADWLRGLEIPAK